MSSVTRSSVFRESTVACAPRFLRRATIQEVGRRSGKRPGVQVQERPSLFFIIALVIALALLVWGASVLIRTPMSNTKSLGRVVTASGIEIA
jgi:hypothetical protein